jgi:hypothetical protein
VLLKYFFSAASKTLRVLKTLRVSYRCRDYRARVCRRRSRRHSSPAIETATPAAPQEASQLLRSPFALTKRKGCCARCWEEMEMEDWVT